MSNIIFNLNQAESLVNMSPPALPGGQFGQAILPAGMNNFSGLYIILNTEPANGANNRYVGISSNIQNRFGTRLAAVTELGFSNNVLRNLAVFWGHAFYQNTLGANLLVPNVMQMPTQNAPGPFTQAPAPNPPHAYEVPIDGRNINLEHVLVRTLLHFWPGHTVSNNQLVGQLTNNSGNPVTVVLNWGPVPAIPNAGVGGTPGGHFGAVWAHGTNL